MKHVELVFVIEMAHKTKTILTRAVREKIKKENAQRARKVKGKIGQNAIRKEKNDTKKKAQGEKGCGRRGAEKKCEKGAEGLKRNKKFQLSTDVLIQRLPFQRVVQEIVQAIQADLRFQSTTIMALQEAGDAFLVGQLEQANLCTIHMKCVTTKPKDLQPARQIRGDILILWGFTFKFCFYIFTYLINFFLFYLMFLW